MVVGAQASVVFLCVINTISSHVYDMKMTRRNENEENSASFWNENAQKTIREKLSRKVNENQAKNVIFFLGDGMSIPTVTATRVYLGGEEHQLSFEKFPYTGLSKTYAVDKQVPDSASTATAYLSGVKANYGTIGVTAAVPLTDCPSMLNTSNWAFSLAHLFQRQNRMTGLVSTARVTHASPAGVYAHTAQRNWETDSDVIRDNYNPLVCPDIASQLIYGETGRQLNVILGGGRQNFIPYNETDEEGNPGNRTSPINLIQKWRELKSQNSAYVWNRQQLENVINQDDLRYLLGLFGPSHMDYNAKRDKSKEPSLGEMTAAALAVLENSHNGYFLFVEGAKIDMGHHEGKAKLALDETSEFSNAIQLAMDVTNEKDTLIVVTADHAHTMSFSGYSERGNDIFGLAGKASDGHPYSTLSYANGPGFKPFDQYGNRYDLSNDRMWQADYVFPGLAPMERETHGGDDVAIYARGPWAHLFSGVMEQNVIPHLVAFAACVGDGITACDSGAKKSK